MLAMTHMVLLPGNCDPGARSSQLHAAVSCWRVNLEHATVLSVQIKVVPADRCCCLCCCRCVRWLDELIVALWHDLQAYMEWKVWDQSLREARGEAAAAPQGKGLVDDNGL